MFCPKCRCEYIGWTGRCPICKIPLVSERPPELPSEGKKADYQTLVDRVRQNGGQLKIELTTTDIGMAKKWRIPFLGYGFAWAKRMQGVLDEIQVDLSITEVGTNRGWSFPYFGFGFAWEKEFRGTIAGNEVVLRASKVSREKKWSFPFLGYGFAWTSEMTGECGEQLKVELITTDVGRKREWGFPYFGFAFAWANKGRLTLLLEVPAAEPELSLALEAG